MNSSERNEEGIDIGPMVDNGAPSNDIGFIELVNLAADIAPAWYGQSEPPLELLVNTKYWK